MRCPYCAFDNDRVVDSRLVGEGNAIRRRRNCLHCNRRFTTYERIEAIPRFVVKRDMRREMFSRDKILAGVYKACQKLPVSPEDLEVIVARIESEIFESYDHEVESSVIGEKVIESLKILHPVAYVRFASVYRRFEDVREYLRLLEEQGGPQGIGRVPANGGNSTVGPKRGNGGLDKRTAKRRADGRVNPEPRGRTRLDTDFGLGAAAN